MSRSAVHLAVVALFLQSVAWASPCHHSTFKFVPQTATAVGCMIEKIGEMHVNNVTVPPQTITSNLTIQKFSVDYEKMNSHQEMMMDMKMANNKSMHMEVNQIMNWEARSLTMFIKGDGLNAKCHTIKLPALLPPARMVNFLLDRLMSMYKCVGRHGDFDKYAFGFDFPPAWLPVPMKESVNMHLEVDVDDNGLLKSENLKESVKTPKMDVDIDMGMLFSDGRLGGPSASDLVPPPSWGCAAPESEHHFFEEWSRFAVGRNRLIPQVIKAAHAEGMQTIVL